MKKIIDYINKPNEALEIEICKIPDWDGFDKLIKFLENEYSAEILDKFDGIGSRKWTLQSYGIKYLLIHDDFFGNSIRALSTDGDPLIHQIANDLKERLKDID